MTVYAIGDLHLPGGDDKSMDIFGAHWEGHFEKISADWLKRVRSEDIVLLPGDISWAMRLEEAAEDLDAIGALPGRKIMIRGNHDYWWSSISKVRERLTGATHAIQNDSIVINGTIFCGTRGWLLPGSEGFTREDEKIYNRELQRLKLSLQDGVKKSEGNIIAALHYPPVTEKKDISGFTQLLEEFKVSHCVYGHLHGAGLQNAFTGILRGVQYHQVSCDGLNFSLKKICET